MPEYNPNSESSRAQSHSFAFQSKSSHLHNTDVIFSELASSPCIGVTHPQHQLEKEQIQSQQQQEESNRSQKKPRSSWAAFRRNLSTLAGQTKPKQSNKSIRFNTQPEFRNHFLRNNRQRILRDPEFDLCFRMSPIIMNGDCGFTAIAKGINIARQIIKTKEKEEMKSSNMNKRTSTLSIQHRVNRFLKKALATTNTDERKRILQAVDIRHSMRLEIRQAKKTYLADSQTYAGVFSDADFEKLEKDVGRPGISGHWLGTVLGVLEHVIVAHAMNINIYLYQFDLQRQCIRQFERATVDNADYDVYLFFTGPAASGHFDTLVRINEPKENTFHA